MMHRQESAGQTGGIIQITYFENSACLKPDESRVFTIYKDMMRTVRPQLGICNDCGALTKISENLP